MLTLHPGLEQTLAGALQPTETGVALLVEPALMQRLVTAVAQEVERAASRGHQVALLTSARVRRPLRRLLERALPQLPVLAYGEIASEVEVEALGMVEVHDDAR